MSEPGLALRLATAQDLPFARTLTRRGMLTYYLRHDLLWLDEAFDVAWAGRENWLICQEDRLVGFVSLSRDDNALYIRELHILEDFRRQGAGSWVLEQMFAKARAESRGYLRLTVFKTNPAKRLYQRQGLSIVGEEGCFWRMESVCLSAQSSR